MKKFTAAECQIMEILAQMKLKSPRIDKVRERFYESQGDASERARRDRFARAMKGLAKARIARRHGRDRYGKERLRLLVDNDTLWEYSHQKEVPAPAARRGRVGRPPVHQDWQIEVQFGPWVLYSNVKSGHLYAYNMKLISIERQEGRASYWLRADFDAERLVETPDLDVLRRYRPQVFQKLDEYFS